MGMYDYFTGTCPHCDKDFTCQTKLFDDDMKSFKPGDRVTRSHFSANVLCKSTCEHCSNEVVAVIDKGVLIQLARPDTVPATHREGGWGALEEVNERM
jgi:hypothetical protein